MPDQQYQPFDPERYAAAYPDVALSGLSPREHYRRFGRLLGRDPTGRTGLVGEAFVDSVDAEKFSEFGPLDAVQAPMYVPQSGEAIIARPEDLDLDRVRSLPAEPKYQQEPISLDAFASGPFGSAEERARICSPLAAYASLTSSDAPEGITLADDPCGQSTFKMGSAQIANIWFVGAKTLRLMINGRDSELLGSEGWSLRAYQGLPGEAGRLRAAGNGVALPAFGPAFHDFELADRLMPIILEVSGAEGETRGLALLSFPSLLPGGIHAAELRALQSQGNPMDAFWSLSEQLLREVIGEPERSIGSVGWGEVPGQDAAGLIAEVRDWTRAIFGISENASGRDGASIRLDLPAESIPTITALVTRRIDAMGTGPYLVAESGTFRPRWSVALPGDSEGFGTLPALTSPDAATTHAGGPSMHLAIVLRDRQRALVPAVARQAQATDLPQMTVLLDVTDAARSSATLDAIRATKAEQADILLGSSEGPGPIDLQGVANAPALAGKRSLAEIARDSRHDFLLTISDRVEFDTQVLGTLVALLEDRNAASASCVLLGDVNAKMDRVARPAFGGIFPTGVSFISCPALSFSEPDVVQALAELVYPVVANTRHFTLWRSSALAQIALPQGSMHLEGADIRLGLDLMTAGYRNICSSRVMVPIRGPYKRQDAIDPVGPNYVSISNWQDILSRVTILRELF